MNNKAVILANGAFPRHPIPLGELKSSQFIVCCDGAINNLEKVGLHPYAIVGDLDSLDSRLKEKYHDLIYHFADQNTNDLTKAVNWCLAKGFDEVVIIGASGLREDHMIGNVFLLPSYAQKIKVTMLTDHGSFIPLLESAGMDSFKGQQVSLFSPSPNTVITTHNLRYALNSQSLQMMWQGTLNESLGDSFRVDLQGDSLIVYQVYS
jgi:thiamine pyrophosphokinase